VTPAPATPARATPPTPATTPEPAAILVVFDTGQRAELSLPGVGYFGRRPAGPDAGDQAFAVQDPDGSVSKTHLRLDYAQGSVWVTDLGSTNGTDLMTDEGAITRLPANVPTAVDEGMRVRMGKRVFTASPLLPQAPIGNGA
jgi:hypothetical protein